MIPIHQQSPLSSAARLVRDGQTLSISSSSSSQHVICRDGANELFSPPSSFLNYVCTIQFVLPLTHSSLSPNHPSVLSDSHTLTHKWLASPHFLQGECGLFTTHTL
ncbi:hypothetical protein BLNAU_23395 [Blattamonas nauphoetae]|uniref:Uncharacterized protein n=1 Tax=Blattamonas nauphoetae TaxID=2049346 RepID=A0ABQ9WQD2_9EUKA|nr:hypothetical protein BLNAU_23395 [Blattamonas nauphoetae]